MSAAPPRAVTFGELMLRLSPPGQERLFQSPQLRTGFGGCEAPVRVCRSFDLARLRQLGRRHARRLTGGRRGRRLGPHGCRARAGPDQSAQREAHTQQ